MEAGITDPRELAPFSCSYSAHVPELLLKLNCSLAISTYQAGKVIFLSPKNDDQLIQLPRTFEKPMGIAILEEPDKMAVACKDEVIVFANSKELAFSYPKKKNTYDALYMPRTTFHIGQLDIHDLNWGEEGLFAVNTLFSCIISLDDNYNFTPYWTPPSINGLKSEDRCHLNGMVMPHLNPFGLEPDSVTVASPVFALPQQNPFGITPADTFGSPALVDIDHDGDLDLFVGEYYGDMLYFENTGSANSPVFAPLVTNPFGLVPTNDYNLPAFADLDNDGDEDLLVGEYYGSFQYFQNTEFNTGIPDNPQETFFDIYPNPATNEVYITLKDENPIHSIEISIIDLNGRVIKPAIIINDDLRLTTDDLSPGVYFVRLIREDKVFTRKLIIK